HLLHPRARVGDRGEVTAGALGTDRPPDAIEEVLQEDVRLERGAGLARHDEERAGHVDPALDRADLSRVGRVEDEELRIAGDATESRPENLRTEARAAHAEHQRVREPGAADLAGQIAERARAGALLAGDGEPPEPARLVGTGPQGRIPRPEALHLVAGAPLVELGAYRRLEAVRQPERRLAAHGDLRRTSSRTELPSATTTVSAVPRNRPVSMTPGIARIACSRAAGSSMGPTAQSRTTLKLSVTNGPSS